MQNRRGGGGAQTPKSGGLSFGGLLQGIFLGAVIFLLGIGLVGIVVSLTDWETAPPSLASALFYVSVAVGGFLASRQAGRIGWLHGGLVGLLFMTLVVPLTSGGGIATLTQTTFILQALAGFFAGAIGGMLGVNTK